MVTIDEKYRGKNTSDILHIFTTRNFVKTTVLPDKALFWGIRNSSINLYYCGMSIGKIEKPRKKHDRLVVTVASEYLGYGKGRREQLKLSDWENEYSKIKNRVKAYQWSNTKYEKIIQQIIASDSNRNPDSTWFCFDMEYNDPRLNRSDRSFGRFDIVALSRKPSTNGKHKLLLIELKYGTHAYTQGINDIKRRRQNNQMIFADINAGSGIAGHVCDYIRYAHPHIGNYAIYRLINEYMLIMDNILTYKLQDKTFVPCPQGSSWDDESRGIDIEPIIAIITMGCDDINKCRKQMSKYLFANNGSSTINAEKIFDVCNDYKFNISKYPLGIEVRERGEDFHQKIILAFSPESISENKPSFDGTEILNCIGIDGQKKKSTVTMGFGL
jgi:hypothetical protein